MRSMQITAFFLGLLRISVVFSAEATAILYQEECPASDCEIKITNAGAFKCLVRTTVLLTEDNTSESTKTDAKPQILRAQKVTVRGAEADATAKKIKIDTTEFSSFTFLGENENSSTDGTFFNTDPKSVKLNKGLFEMIEIIVMHTITTMTTVKEDNQPVEFGNIASCYGGPSPVCTEKKPEDADFSAVYFKGDTLQLPVDLTFKKGDEKFVIHLVYSSATTIFTSFALGICSVLLVSMS